MKTQYSINITPTDTANEFSVGVILRTGEFYSYTVSVDTDALVAAQTLAVRIETVIRHSFHFLLEQESPEEILPAFLLSDISTYFPDYPDELLRRVKDDA